MGGKKTGREGREAGRATKADPATRGHDSEDAESETSAMSGTSSDKRRLAETRHELREAGEDALRMVAAHETPTETPIYGPGNIFSTGDDGVSDGDDSDEIDKLRLTLLLTTSRSSVGRESVVYWYSI